MIKWIKKILGITELEERVANLQDICDNQRMFISQQMLELQKHINVDVDMGFYENKVIVSGTYMKRPYVQIYDLSGKNFSHIVDYLKVLLHHSRIMNIDCPSDMLCSFKDHLRN